MSLALHESRQLFEFVGEQVVLLLVLVHQAIDLSNFAAILLHLPLKPACIFNRKRVHALLKFGAQRTQIVCTSVHVGLDFRQIFVLNEQGSVHDCQLLRVLNQVANFAVLFAQRLHLQVPLENFSLSAALLRLVCRFKKVLGCDPLVK